MPFPCTIINRCLHDILYSDIKHTQRTVQSRHSRSAQRVRHKGLSGVYICSAGLRNELDTKNCLESILQVCAKSQTQRTVQSLCCRSAQRVRHRELSRVYTAGLRKESDTENCLESILQVCATSQTQRTVQSLDSSNEPEIEYYTGHLYLIDM